MTYSMKCPSEGCDYVVRVEADDEEAAVSKIMEDAGQHAAVVHPQMAMDAAQMEQMVRGNMQKE